MRTKKQIRKGRISRVIWSYVLFGLSFVMFALAYLTIEYSGKISEMGLFGLTNFDNQSKYLITMICVILGITGIMLFVSGLFVILNRKVRHHGYVARPHSSSVE